VINLTNISFNDDENKLLQKGLKYNLHPSPKQWIKTLAIEAETALTLLPQVDRSPIRYQISKAIDKLITEADKPRSMKTLRDNNRNSERNTIRSIKTKLLQHNDCSRTV
jgi:hypothetical protein